MRTTVIGGGIIRPVWQSSLWGVPPSSLSKNSLDKKIIRQDFQFVTFGDEVLFVRCLLFYCDGARQGCGDLRHLRVRLAAELATQLTARIAAQLVAGFPNGILNLAARQLRLLQ